MPMVSVVIPTFNRRALVLEAVDSVLAQGRDDVEVLVVDDASEDDTEAALRERYGASPAVRCLRHATNRGVSTARNTGIEAAQGRFVAFLDSDDIALPGRLDRQCARFAADPRLIAVGGAVAVAESDLTITQVLRYPEQDLDIRWRGLFTPMLCLGAGMVALPAMRQAGVRFDESIRIGEDFDFLSALLVHGPAANLTAPLIKVRKHAGNSAIRSMEAYRRTLLRCAQRNVAAVGMPMEPRELQELHAFLNHDGLLKAGIDRQRWIDLHDRARALLDAMQRHSISEPDRHAAIAASLHARLQAFPESA